MDYLKIQTVVSVLNVPTMAGRSERNNPANKKIRSKMKFEDSDLQVDPGKPGAEVSKKKL